MLILDIGCGRKKIKGATGIDFSPMSDADVALDLNTDKLPFDDNSVDFIYSSHTLEHLTLDGFMNVMREAYRVMKPDAQFKIVVPYFTTLANLANPFHNNIICFNEHTFRFFSSEVETSSISHEAYASPSCPHWGLRYSANSEIGMEFRTIAMQFFYFPQFRHLSEREKVEARQSRIDVVDQISYSLMAIKPCPSKPETGPVASSDDPHVYVDRQIVFLNGQIEWLTMKQVNSAEIEFAKRTANNLIRIGDLYLCGKVLTPVNQLVYELDDIIQALRHQIDNIVASSHLNESDGGGTRPSH